MNAPTERQRENTKSRLSSALPSDDDVHIVDEAVHRTMKGNMSSMFKMNLTGFSGRGNQELSDDPIEHDEDELPPRQPSRMRAPGSPIEDVEEELPPRQPSRMRAPGSPIEDVEEELPPRQPSRMITGASKRTLQPLARPKGLRSSTRAAGELQLSARTEATRDINDPSRPQDVERAYTRIEEAENIRQEREEEKERKRSLKEVNKVRTKENSTPEMIVDLPLSIEGNYVNTRIRETLKMLKVEASTYSTPLPNVIKWRRKVTAVFNEELGYWEPVLQEIRHEKHVLCLLSAKEFVDMASVNSVEVDGQDLESHVLRMKHEYEHAIPIYLIEGLEIWMLKNINIRNGANQPAVLSRTDGQATGPPTASPSERKQPAVEYIDKDMVEDSLVRLQVRHGCLIHHTAVPIETAEWVVKFTQHISTCPYRKERMGIDTSFCPDIGQVKTGDDTHDTYVRMLRGILNVTAPIAYRFAAEYPSVGALVQGFRSKGCSALADLKKGANKNGAPSDARIGPALSKRLFEGFMGTNPDSNDV